MLTHDIEENKSLYLSKISKLTNSFFDENIANLVVALTDEDFNRAESIARHNENEFLARVVIVTKNKKIVTVFDFKENLKLSIPADREVKISPIGEKMLEHLKTCYGFSYDSNGRPVFG